MASAIDITFPGNLPQVSTLAELRDVPSPLLPQDQAYLVPDYGIYFYDQGSMATDNDSTVIKPDDITTLQAGRWILSNVILTTYLNAQARPFEEFLSASYDYTTDDCSAALVAAATWSAANQRPVGFSSRYRIANCATITATGVKFQFNNPRFDVLDNGTYGTLTNAASGPIGILFKNSDYLNITGFARFFGQGAPGATHLAAVVYDHCDYANVCGMYAENMAAGRFVLWCDNGAFGNIVAKSMYGRQTFEPMGVTTAGTADVIGGCRGSNFGWVVADDNYKPARYMTVIVEQGGAKISNTRCVLDSVTMTGRSGSLESVGLAVRAASGCTFGATIAHNAVIGVDCENYATDTGFVIEDCTFGDIYRDGPHAVGASLDAAMQTSMEGGAPTIGRLHFSRIICRGTGTHGIFLGAGEVSWDNADLEALTPVFHGACKVSGGYTRVANQNEVAYLYNASAKGVIEHIDIQTGAASGAFNGVQNAAGTTASGLMFERISYAQNGIGTNILAPFVDTMASPEAVRVGYVAGAGSSGKAFWNATAYNFPIMNLSLPSIPTVGTWTVGQIVWNSAPAIGSPQGWVCTVAGTPGTWKPFGIVGELRIAAQADSTAIILADLVTDFNAVLAKLRTAGLMAP